MAMPGSDLQRGESYEANRLPGASARLAATGSGSTLRSVLTAAGLDDSSLALLVITSDSAMALADPSRERTLYLVPSGNATAPPDGRDAVRLPMPDAAFDVVLGYRLVRPGFDAGPWLREAVRVLRLDGSLVLVTEPKDFQSAPLPPAGPAYLAQRTLAAAGLASAHFIQHDAQAVAVVRRRDAVGTPGR